MAHIRQSRLDYGTCKDSHVQIMAHIRQPKPDCGLGPQAKVLTTFSPGLMQAAKEDSWPAARASRGWLATGRVA